MGRSRQALKRRAHRGRQTAQSLQLGFVGRQPGLVGQGAVHEQVRHLFKLRSGREVEDVVAAVVQVVAAAAYSAERGVSRGSA